jgi:hypothetical protein
MDVPEWGGSINIKTMTGTERDLFDASLAGKDGKADLTNYHARFVVRVVVDADGARIFEDKDAEALGAKSAKVISRVYDKAARLNGLMKDEAEKN